eukprot:3711197-Amphidinium_carterae.1
MFHKWCKSYCPKHQTNFGTHWSLDHQDNDPALKFLSGPRTTRRMVSRSSTLCMHGLRTTRILVL